LSRIMEREDPERLGLLALGNLPDHGPVRLSEVLDAIRAGAGDLRSFLNLSPSGRRRCVPSHVHSSLDLLPDAIQKARSLSADLARAGVSWMVAGDPGYPARLRCFLGRNAPFLLYYHGNPDLLSNPSILGIIGTRKPSIRGAKAAFSLGMEAGEQDICVASGGAMGIDTAAHAGALEAGSTIIVLPRGILRAGRFSHLARNFNPENHLILSEFPPFYRGNKTSPIVRNRTVAALSDAVAVVETGVRGGTLHTVRFAREMGKPILVTDFSPESNPRGNASLLSTVGEAIKPTSWEDIHNALERGLREMEKEKGTQLDWDQPEWGQFI